MKGRRTGKGPPAADLMVCFPSRAAHLTLMPKPICSPARPPSEPNKRQPNQHLINYRQIKKFSKRNGIIGSGIGQASPLLWAKTKSINNEIISEPTSPKVTCAGQIKVRPKANPCKTWQSVMEEIERLHNNRRKHKKRSTSWVETLGFKKDVMQFLTCLRNIRFDFRCFGSFPTPPVISSDDDDDGEEEYEGYHQENHFGGERSSSDDGTSKTFFSKWFMVLQQNQNNAYMREKSKDVESGSYSKEPVDPPCVPPPNALLLMRCRSAPAKSWLEKRETQEDADEDEEEEEKELEEEKKEHKLTEQEKGKMRYETDIDRISSEIGGIRDSLMFRSRSWKR